MTAEQNAEYERLRGDLADLLTTDDGVDGYVVFHRIREILDGTYERSGPAHIDCA